MREVCKEWSMEELERKSKLKIIILFNVLHLFTLLLFYGFINNILFFIFTLFGGLPGAVIGITGGSNWDYSPVI